MFDPKRGHQFHIVDVAMVMITCNRAAFTRAYTPATRERIPHAILASVFVGSAFNLIGSSGDAPLEVGGESVGGPDYL